MQHLKIRDLEHSQELDRAAMSAVRGGGSSLPLGELGRFASVNVEVNQNIAQFQDIEINALNNVGVIGAGFGPLKFNLSPKQLAETSVAL